MKTNEVSKTAKTYLGTNCTPLESTARSKELVTVLAARQIGFLHRHFTRAVGNLT